MTRDEVIAAYSSGRRDFTDVDLDLEHLDLSGLTLADADFTGCWVDASFDNSDLRNARFVNANVKGCTFVNANLTGADFRGSALEASDFEGAKLDSALFAGATAYGYTFVDGDLPTQ